MKYISAGLLCVLGSLAWGGIDDLVMTEVDPFGDVVEITSFGTEGYTNSTGLPFCHRFNYSRSIAAGTVWMAGESRIFSVTGLDDGGSDVWLYRQSPFSTAANILSGMQYGGGNFGRAALASTVGLWPSGGAFVPVVR